VGRGRPTLGRGQDLITPKPALLLVSFGGPEGPADVLPFLRNVTRGRNVPDERLASVAAHYDRFGGVSPINGQNRALLAALRELMPADVPLYWGNRNWHPLLADTVRQMREDGVEHAYAFATSAFSSYSGCRQYREDLAGAIAEVGVDVREPRIDRLRQFFNAPGFIDVMADRVREVITRGASATQTAPVLLFVAHSIPIAQAEASGPLGGAYPRQLAEAARLVAEAVADDGPVHRWQVAYSSRSGPPSQPWLEPDVGDALAQLAADGVRDVVVVPIGFVSDHMEVVYDLDVEAARRAESVGIRMVRAGTVGTDQRFVAMVGELYRERVERGVTRMALGTLGPGHDQCPQGCCLVPGAPDRPAIGGQ
jgi:ferrochelatase